MSDQYVIDTSALMQAYIRDTLTDHVDALLSLLGADDPPVLHFLRLELAECANVVWKHVRRGTISADDAHLILTNLLSLPLRWNDAESRLIDTLNIGLTHDLAIYDCLVIALAKALNCPLVTADARQERVAVQVGVVVKSITDFTPST